MGDVVNYVPPAFASASKEQVIEHHYRQMASINAERREQVRAMLVALGMPVQLVNRLEHDPVESLQIALTEHVLDCASRGQDWLLLESASRAGFGVHGDDPQASVDVYRLTCGNFCYIGVTSDADTRWSAHVRDLNGGTHPARLMGDYFRDGHELTAEVIDRAPAGGVLSLEQGYINAAERVGYSVANTQRRVGSFGVRMLPPGANPNCLFEAHEYVDEGYRAKYIAMGPFRYKRRYVGGA